MNKIYRTFASLLVSIFFIDFLIFLIYTNINTVESIVIHFDVWINMCRAFETVNTKLTLKESCSRLFFYLNIKVTNSYRPTCIFFGNAKDALEPLKIILSFYLKKNNFKKREHNFIQNAACLLKTIDYEVLRRLLCTSWWVSPGWPLNRYLNLLWNGDRTTRSNSNWWT